MRSECGALFHLVPLRTAPAGSKPPDTRTGARGRGAAGAIPTGSARLLLPGVHGVGDGGGQKSQHACSGSVPPTHGKAARPRLAPLHPPGSHGWPRRPALRKRVLAGHLLAPRPRQRRSRLRARAATSPSARGCRGHHRAAPPHPGACHARERRPRTPTATRSPPAMTSSRRSPRPRPRSSP